MFGLGMQELIIILVIALLVFGANKLPEIGRGLGRGIREFRKASSELTGGAEEAEEALLRFSTAGRSASRAANRFRFSVGGGLRARWARSMSVR